MPTMETSDRIQKAVYWAANGNDNYGRVKVDARVELEVRWEKRWRESVDDDGNTVATEARVVVDRVIPVDSILWLGSMEEYAAKTTPTDFKQVISYDEIPDVKGRVSRRTVTLMKYSDELPDLTS